jgi:hypothetical protein
MYTLPNEGPLERYGLSLLLGGKIIYSLREMDEFLLCVSVSN